LTNLIIKYTVYIAVWEKSYYKNDIFRIIHGKFSNYEIKTHEKTETELEDTDFESDSCVRNYDKIVEDFDEGTEVEKSDAKRMYDEIHQKLSVLPGMDSSKADFFYVNKHSLKYKHKTLCQIMKITKRIMAREKKRRDGKEYKKYIFEHAVKEEPYAQISFKLCDLLQLGVEIVAFNIIRFNGKLLYKEDKLSYEKVTSGSAEKWFIDYADDMQLKIIPYLHFILCCSAKEKDEKDKKDKKDKDYFSPYIVMYKEAVGMFDNIDGFRLLDKSNWGNNENETRKEIEKKARKYWRVRRLSIRKKAKTTENYTAVNIRSKMQYSDKRQRYIFPDIHLQQMAIKYEFFIKETKGAMTANISTELQRQL
jgi:hypothetical protein